LNNFTLITLQNEKIKDIDGVKLTDDVVRKIESIEREKTISISGSSNHPKIKYIKSKYIFKEIY
jgi:hypothetical protein